MVFNSAVTEVMTADEIILRNSKVKGVVSLNSGQHHKGEKHGAEPW